MAKIELKPAPMLYPLPAVMVSCGSMEESNIITIGWTGIICTNPPRTYVSIMPSRFSHDIVEKRREFVINLTTRDLAYATDICGIKSGRDIDKFRETGLTKVKASHVSCPMIAESPVNIECRVFNVERLGSHDMYMADIVGVHVNEELMDESGRVALEHAGLISYFHGHYFGINDEQIGRFGWTVMKEKTKKRLAKESARAAHSKKEAFPEDKKPSPAKKASFAKKDASPKKSVFSAKKGSAPAKKSASVKKDAPSAGRKKRGQ